MSAVLFGQTRIDLATQSRSVDFSAATATKPSKTGTVIPPVCSIGETFFKTNAEPGKNLFGCTGTNTWTLLAVQSLPGLQGMSGRILSNDGSGSLWSAPGGDVAGPVDSLTVRRLQGRTISQVPPTDGQALIWNNAAGQWEPGAKGSDYVAGTGIAIAGSTLSLDTALVTQYYVGSGVPVVPCEAGRDLYTDTANQKLYFCKASNTWQLLTDGAHTHSASDLTAGILSFSRGGTNQTSWTAGRCVQVSADGVRLESSAAACGSGSTGSGAQYYVGSGVPAMACVTGRDFYTDTATQKLYFCRSTNIWQLLSDASHAHTTSDLTTGTLAFERGGTNQTSWTAGRCVQVSADGARLESSAAACGGSGGGALKQMFSGAVIGTIAGSTTAYTSINGTAFSAASEASKRTPMTSAGTFSNALLSIYSGTQNTDTIVCKLRVNGADSALTITVPVGSSNGTVAGSTGSASVQSGDQVAWGCFNRSTATSASVASISVEFIFN